MDMDKEITHKIYINNIFKMQSGIILKQSLHLCKYTINIYMDKLLCTQSTALQM